MRRCSGKKRLRAPDPVEGPLPAPQSGGDVPARLRERSGTRTLLPEGSRRVVTRRADGYVPIVEAGPEAAAAILSNSTAAEVFVNSADPRLLVNVYRRVRDSMEAVARRELLRRVVSRLSETARNLWDTRRARKPTEMRVYRPGDGDWDLDATLEQMAQNPDGILTYEDFRTRTDDSSGVAICLMVDKSQSISRMLHDVAVACAMVCHALKDEMISVLVFDKSVEFIRRFDDADGPERVIEKILDMDCGGATDLVKPLLAAEEEMTRAPASRLRRGILVSDLVATRGADPLCVTRDMTSLRIVCVPGFRDEPPPLAFALRALPNVDLIRAGTPEKVLESLLQAALTP